MRDRIAAQLLAPDGTHLRRRFGAGMLLAGFIAGSIAAQAPPPAQLNPDDVINHLNTVIAWYRDVTTKVQPVGLPTDTAFQENAESIAADAVRLAFESARDEAAIAGTIEKGPASETGQAASGSTPNVARTQAQVAARIEEIQTQLAALNKQIAAAPARKRQALISQRDALQGQMELNKAVLDAVQKMANFLETSGGSSGTGLAASIGRLAQSVPELLGKTAAQGQKPPAAAKPSGQPDLLSANSRGLAGQAFALYSLVRTMHEIDLLAKETDEVREAATQVRKPLRDAMLAILQRGQAVPSSNAGQPSNQTSPGQTQPSQPQNNQSGAAANLQSQAPLAPADYAALTNQFKQLSNAALPLSQEILLLEQSKTNLTEWRSTISRESGNLFLSLLFHLILIAAALALVLVLSEVWRRLTFRYIHDTRRRRQFLLIRRFVIGFLMGVVLILGFVSEFSSLATFAGLLTAGIAVGLQAVLLCIAAYFFLIGRWGIRVGDRITISGVTGDVVDVGLVRFYLIELAGTGIDLFPTGRIAVFANSVLFQANTPLYKQIPGTEYAWHEVAVPLAPIVANGDYKGIQEKLVAAVNSVYTRYRGEIERQYDAIEERIDIRLTVPSPEGRLQVGDGGLEFLVRYPVEIRRAAEIDEQITESVMETVSKEEKLKSAVPGLPKIRAAVRG